MGVQVYALFILFERGQLMADTSDNAKYVMDSLLAKLASFSTKKRNKRTKDIELPNESGEGDPRLRGSDMSASIRKAGEGFRALRKKY